MQARRLAPPLLFNEAIPSCCFWLDLAYLEHNLDILAKVQELTQAKILLALKAFAAWAVFPRMSRAFQGPLWGTCASSVNEARLGRENFQGEVHCFAAAYSEDEIYELIGLCDHIVFNSIAQFRRFKDLINKSSRKISIGLRINPEHSEGATAIYDPCAPSSRLGVRLKDFDPLVMQEGLQGLHFHTLCEQDSSALARTLDTLLANFDPYFKKCQWINFGGGHHITRADYDLELLCKCILDWQKRYQATIYLEPGEACALDAGFLTARVLDIVSADTLVAILDVSPTCHMPDTLEMPYDPPVFYALGSKVYEASQNDPSAPYKYRLAGKSCLAGDFLKASYGFEAPLQVGSRIVFGDMAIYSMVKTTTFNGLNLPAIGYFENEKFSLIKTFGYEDFKSRLS